ncbi:2Fe-2S iron-sulfur cluster-binding protein [Lacinutrix chionoecetis]
MSHFHKLSIKNIQRLTEDAVAISFLIPESLKSNFSFTAGQYVTLKTTINGKEIRRDYSLCASPKSGDITVAIKKVEHGTFSKFANSTLQKGDTIEVAEPQGRFIFKPNPLETRTIVAFAAGSGITPVISIAKTVLEEEPNSKFVLVYGNKSTDDTMFLEQLLKLHHDYKERFDIQFVFSQAKEPDALFGRIEKSTVNLIIKNRYKHKTIDAFYLCGPEAMINTVKDVLSENGIAIDLIFYELFKVAKAQQAIESEVNTGETKIKVIVDDEEETFTMPQSQTILEAALDNDLDAPYSCQGGICSSCIARVTEGTAAMRQNNILTDSEVAEGLVLTCQAQPTSANIVVDYDDV